MVTMVRKAVAYVKTHGREKAIAGHQRRAWVMGRPLISAIDCARLEGADHCQQVAATPSQEATLRPALRQLTQTRFATDR